RVGANLYASPVVFGGTVFAATESDTVVAMTLSSGSVIWKASLGSPLPGSNLPCGDINPSGITGTPVIDPVRRLLWVVAFVKPGHHVLFGLDLQSGRVKVHTNVDPPGLDPLVEQQRGALALVGDRVIVPFGGLYGDCGSYHGALESVSATGARLGDYQVPGRRQGGLWAPGGVAVDSTGNLFVTSGNGEPFGLAPGGDTVLSLNSSLALTDWFTPPGSAQLDRADTDLGSTGPVLLGGGLLFQIGKSGIGYLLSASALGHSGTNFFSRGVCEGAYGAAAATAKMIFVPCSQGLYALRLGPGPGFAVAWKQVGWQPGPMVVAASTVWALDPQAGVLIGLDAASGREMARLQVGRASRWSAPAAAGGVIVIGAGQAIRAIGN
ncbi:MAG: PQQ-binding-like beta-propeller repeat protein, partial [Acidimicrobiales bacterium]